MNLSCKFSFQNFSKIICLSVMSLAISACSSFGDNLPNWLGGNSEEVLEGERISVLAKEGLVEADKSLMNKKMIIPAPKENSKWYQSGGYYNSIVEHPNAPQGFTKHYSIDAGSPNPDDSKLKISPIVAENKLIVMDGRGVLRVYDVNNFKEKFWSRKLQSENEQSNFSLSGMVYDDGAIYVTSGGHKIFAINIKDGSILWTKSISGITRSAPTASGDMIYVNTLENRLYALNKKDGVIIWSHEGIKENVGTKGVASPSVDDGVVYTAYSSGELYALNYQSGKRMWLDALLSGNSKGSYILADIDATPIIKNEIVYSVSNDGVMAAIDASNGFRVWEQKIASNSTPWMAGSNLFVITNKNQIICLDADSGRVRWTYELPSYRNEEYKRGAISWSSPVLAGKHILVVGSHGKMFQLSPYSGELVNEIKVANDVFAPLVVVNNKLILIDNDSYLHIYSDDG